MRVIRTVLAAAALTAAVLPAAASATPQCDIWWPKDQLVPTVVC